jgi:hypothetical protein
LAEAEAEAEAEMSGFAYLLYGRELGVEACELT